MPYKIVKTGDEYRVYVNHEGRHKFIGTHDTKEKAEAQIKAIEAKKHAG